MNTESTPYPTLVLINVEYLHSFDSVYEPEPVKISLRHSDIFPYPVRPETCEEVLEVIFRQLNHVDGTELCSQPEFKRCRSMSVGDVVTFRGPGGFRQAYVCEGCGWAKVSREEAQWLVENISPRDFWGTFAKTVEKDDPSVRNLKKLFKLPAKN